MYRHVIFDALTRRRRREGPRVNGEDYEGLPSDERFLDQLRYDVGRRFDSPIGNEW